MLASRLAFIVRISSSISATAALGELGSWLGAQRGLPGRLTPHIRCTGSAGFLLEQRQQAAALLQQIVRLYGEGPPAAVGEQLAVVNRA